MPYLAGMAYFDLAATNAAATTTFSRIVAFPIAIGMKVCFHGFTFMVK
jgi:hypothetical protein